MTTTTFDVQVSASSPGYNLPQRIARRLWLPMLAMALMSFAAAVALGIIRADKVSQAAAPDTLAVLQHLTAAFMFLGFAAVFAAISFAIAGILGQFRKGGGDVQEAARRRVLTPRMPWTGGAFLGLMAMAMMTLLAAVALHFVFAAEITDTASSLAEAQDRFIALEAVRRIGVAMYLLAIVFGLATIIRVLRFQAIRIRQLPDEPTVS